MKKYSLLFLALSTCHLLFSQSLHYLFSAPNAAHHEATIVLTAKDLPAGPATFRMSRSSPGRYATHEFGKNIYNVKAFNEAGKALSVVRTEADVYVVQNHTGVIKMQYTFYANHADGTYASVDLTGFHLNMPATFMWVKGLEKAPMTLTFEKPDPTWTIATQLYPTKDANTYTAPNLQYFMDSPTKVGALRYREWTIQNKGGKDLTMRIAFDTEATDAQLDTFAENVKKIVAEAGAVFGEFPNYETGRYTFLASLNPYVQGDGMEHRNSTMISIPVPAASISAALGTFSHEFFHCWNVERIRPKTIEPFNFERSNVSDGLWVAEGFTQYFGDLIELRSGLQTEAAWLGGISSAINTKINRPGGKNYNVIENSQHAVFSDAGTAIDKTNYPNIFSSYYVTGAAMALALELDLRIRFSKTLDQFMQAVWQKNGKPEIAYTMADLQQALAITTGDATYAASFFDTYIFGNKPYDYAAGLSKFGIIMKQREPGKAWISAGRMDEKNGNLVVSSNTIVGTPLYNAGLDIGDEILDIDGEKMTTTALNKWLASKQPGDKAMITYKHRGKEMKHEIVLAASPDILLQLDANADEKATNLRKNWLSSSIK